MIPCSRQDCRLTATTVETWHRARAPETVDVCETHAAEIRAADVCSCGRRAVCSGRCASCTGERGLVVVPSTRTPFLRGPEPRPATTDTDTDTDTGDTMTYEQCLAAARELGRFRTPELAAALGVKRDAARRRCEEMVARRDVRPTGREGRGGGVVYQVVSDHVAQRTERPPPKREVAGSSPAVVVQEVPAAPPAVAEEVDPASVLKVPRAPVVDEQAIALAQLRDQVWKHTDRLNDLESWRDHQPDQGDGLDLVALATGLEALRDAMVELRRDLGVLTERIRYVERALEARPSEPSIVQTPDGRFIGAVPSNAEDPVSEVLDALGVPLGSVAVRMGWLRCHVESLRWDANFQRRPRSAGEGAAPEVS